MQPHLEAALPSADAQQRQFVELILLDLRDPPTTPAKLRRRQRRYLLCGFIHDPVHQFAPEELHRYPFAWPDGIPAVSIEPTGR